MRGTELLCQGVTRRGPPPYLLFVPGSTHKCTYVHTLVRLYTCTQTSTTTRFLCPHCCPFSLPAEKNSVPFLHLPLNSMDLPVQRRSVHLVEGTTFAFSNEALFSLEGSNGERALMAHGETLLSPKLQYLLSFKYIFKCVIYFKLRQDK